MQKVKLMIRCNRCGEEWENDHVCQVPIAFAFGQWQQYTADTIENARKAGR